MSEFPDGRAVGEKIGRVIGEAINEATLERQREAVAAAERDIKHRVRQALIEASEVDAPKAENFKGRSGTTPNNWIQVGFAAGLGATSLAVRKALGDGGSAT